MGKIEDSFFGRYTEEREGRLIEGEINQWNERLQEGYGGQDLDVGRWIPVYYVLFQLGNCANI